MTDYSKRKLFREYNVYVDGRCWETSHTETRKNEIVAILSDMYGAEHVTVEPYNHFASGSERYNLERVIQSQNEYYKENAPYIRMNDK